LASGKEQMRSPVAAKMALHNYMMFRQMTFVSAPRQPPQMTPPPNPAFIHRDEFGEGTDSILGRPCINLVARLESPHP
jgi:hypothetical protein